jgi:hypothetical protein
MFKGDSVSLQYVSTMNAFAASAATLWGNWSADQRTPGQRRRDWRREQIKAMIRTATAFMVTPTIKFQDTGSSNGSFGWEAWTLHLRANRTVQVGLTYADYVKYCRTMYHEARHAEQFYRIAQGLMLGTLKYPGKTGRDVVHEVRVADTAQTFQSTLAMFEKESTGSQIDVTAKVVQQWLSVPANVSTSAYASRAQFTAFVNSGRPLWFKRSSVLLETEEWMRATYAGSLSALNAWTQGDDGPYQMYRNQPEEHDAHGIGNAIVTAVDSATGIASGVEAY